MDALLNVSGLNKHFGGLHAVKNIDFELQQGEMRAVKIDPAAVDIDDISMLEDMIILASNKARAEADATMAARMKDITGDLPLPPGRSLPF